MRGHRDPRAGGGLAPQCGMEPIHIGDREAVEGFAHVGPEQVLPVLAHPHPRLLQLHLGVQGRARQAGETQRDSLAEPDGSVLVQAHHALVDHAIGSAASRGVRRGIRQVAGAGLPPDHLRLEARDHREPLPRGGGETVHPGVGVIVVVRPGVPDLLGIGEVSGDAGLVGLDDRLELPVIHVGEPVAGGKKEFLIQEISLGIQRGGHQVRFGLLVLAADLLVGSPRGGGEVAFLPQELGARELPFLIRLHGESADFMTGLHRKMGNQPHRGHRDRPSQRSGRSSGSVNRPALSPRLSGKNFTCLAGETPGRWQFSLGSLRREGSGPMGQAAGGGVGRTLACPVSRCTR